jgi:hypothetical protein
MRTRSEEQGTNRTLLPALRSQMTAWCQTIGPLRRGPAEARRSVAPLSSHLVISGVRAAGGWPHSIGRGTFLR